MNRLTVDNIDQLAKNCTEQEKNGKNVIILFTGNKNDNGKSWCPDCTVAEPVIEKIVDQLKDESSITFITAPVGNMQAWRDPSNQYRKHDEYQLTCVPTLYNANKKTRLEEGGCADESLVFALFKGTLIDSKTVKAGTCEGGVCRLR